MNLPVQQLHACVKKDLPSHTVVINHDEFEYYLWVKIPPYIARDFRLYQIDEMSEPVHELDPHLYYADPGPGFHPWYRITSSGLCKCPGLHVYRMHFVDKHNGDTLSLFFGYIVQHDDPKKPYIYMDPEGRCACCSKHTQVDE